MLVPLSLVEAYFNASMFTLNSSLTRGYNGISKISWSASITSFSWLGWEPWFLHCAEHWSVNRMIIFAPMNLGLVKQADRTMTVGGKDTMQDPRMEPVIRAEAKNLCHTCKETASEYEDLLMIWTYCALVLVSYHFRAVISLYTQKGANADNRVKSRQVIWIYDTADKFL